MLTFTEQRESVGGKWKKFRGTKKTAGEVK